jgi:penicillin G amidase
MQKLCMAFCKGENFMALNLPSRLFRLFIGAVVLLALAGLLGFAWLRTSLPQTRGTIHLQGLAASVDIVRDTRGVPHIFARSEHDALFALGYVHAQDRLWQMEVNRRIGSGALAEVFGKDALKTDVFLRTIGLRKAAQASYDRLDGDSKAKLASYAKGINAYLHNRKGALPPEFALLQVTPRDWTPIDSLVWNKVMALDMGYMWKREMSRLVLLKHLSKNQIDALIPPVPGVQYPDIAGLEKLYSDLPETLVQHGLLKSPVGAPGSNNWVVSGKRSVTGKPLLANDPHITMASPGVWYLAHIQVAGRNRVGVTFPGMPIIVLGRTDRVAWGFTNTEPDVHDLILEKVKNRYWGEYYTPTGTERFIVRQEHINIKGEKPLTITVRESRNGPVISDAFPEMKKALLPRYVLALKWVALKPGDSTMRAGLNLPKAESVASTIEILRDFEAPQNNVVIADVDGSIGYIAAGTVPLRRADHPTAGLWPALGWLAQSEWVGTVAYENLPRIIDPEQGWIGTANNAIAAPAGQAPLTYDWEEPYRYNRLAALIQATPKHGIASFAAMQADDMDVALRDTIKLLTSLNGFDADQYDMLTKLRIWDGMMRGDRAEALIAMAWVRHFETLLISDDLGKDFSDFDKRRPIFVLNVLRDAALGAQWCDNVTTKEKRETCEEIAAMALRLARAELALDYGRNINTWRLDKAHIVVHEHTPFSHVPLLAKFFELRTPFSGSGDSLHSGHADYSRKNPYEATLSQSYRGIFDLSDMDNSRYVIPTGQSGNPLSKHFKDMQPYWQNNRYITISTDRSVIEKASTEHLVLKP